MPGCSRDGHACSAPEKKEKDEKEEEGTNVPGKGFRNLYHQQLIVRGAAAVASHRRGVQN